MRQKKFERMFIREEISSWQQVVILSVSGMMIGFVNGFFGGGGGVICVPLLEGVLNLPSKYAHATALTIIFPLSLVSSGVYLLTGSMAFGQFLPVCTGVVVGGVLGAVILKVLPEKAIKILFAILMLVGGIRLIF